MIHSWAKSFRFFFNRSRFWTPLASLFKGVQIIHRRRGLSRNYFKTNPVSLYQCDFLIYYWDPTLHYADAQLIAASFSFFLFLSHTILRRILCSSAQFRHRSEQPNMHIDLLSDNKFTLAILFEELRCEPSLSCKFRHNVFFIAKDSQSTKYIGPRKNINQDVIYV